MVNIFFLSTPLVNLILNSQYSLLLSSWMPMEMNGRSFWYFYAFQAPQFVISSRQALTSNLLFMGFTNELCLQFDLLSNRIKNLESEMSDGKLDSKLKELVKHHILIYRWGKILAYSRRSFKIKFFLAWQRCSMMFTKK